MFQALKSVVRVNLLMFGQAKLGLMTVLKCSTICKKDTFSFFATFFRRILGVKCELLFWGLFPGFLGKGVIFAVFDIWVKNDDREKSLCTVYCTFELKRISFSRRRFVESFSHENSSMKERDLHQYFPILIDQSFPKKNWQQELKL